MLIFDKESEIISLFRDLETKSILLLPEYDESLLDLVSYIQDNSEWSKWVDSSAKNELPPDFYCDSHSLMMDVMRVDDCERISEKGKLVNPTKMRERELEKELRQSGITEKLPNARVITIANTGLPTEEDHNYTNYYNNFSRIVENHKRKIENYKKNHPNYKVVFFICDESTAYIKPLIEDVARQEGEIIPSQIHYWFLDQKFLDVFIESQIDYLIWFTPYKLCKTIDGIIDLPRAVVYDTKAKLTNTFDYTADRLISNEM